MESKDSMVLNRIFTYQRNYTSGMSGYSTNFYSKFMYNINRRNFGLWLIPHMYTVAKGDRNFVSEQYGRLHVYDLNDYEHEGQVYYTTIPYNSHTMPILNEFLTPSLYSVLVYGDHILSPFHRDNRRFYRYKFRWLEKGQVRIYFRPRFVKNTQLMQGIATVEVRTGRIVEAVFEGEYDLIKFHTIAMMGTEGFGSLLPKYCQSEISFKFMGNNISSSFESVFDCPIRLPDTVRVEGNRALIDSLRPVPLNAAEQAIYDDYDRRHRPAPVEVKEEPDTTKKEEPAKRNVLKSVGEGIGDFLVSTHDMKTEKYYIRASPFVEPQYISYSGSKGFSYKMRFSAEYYFSHTSGLYLHPEVGYNFTMNQLRFSVPLRYVYNSRTRNFVELIWRNGNQISNNIALDDIRSKVGIGIKLPNDLTLFNDEELRLYSHQKIIEALDLETGAVYHKRTAVNSYGMRSYGKPTVYHSLAPAIGLKFRPWKKGPMFAVDYERGIGSKENSLNYERWEADISLRHYITSLQTFNYRLGGGIYTQRESSYFNDFANFRDNNLPEGWNDEWSGDFQLLDSRLYNQSKYYVRSNISFEAPLMLAAFTPLLGRHVEQERFYWSGLLIEHSRPYSELGYGFSSRYFAMGIFASFFNVEFQQIGTKFTFELFSRW